MKILFQILHTHTGARARMSNAWRNMQNTSLAFMVTQNYREKKYFIEYIETNNLELKETGGKLESGNEGELRKKKIKISFLSSEKAVLFKTV